MYIKLTKLDNTPIWLNAAFIVTIEPRKQGGSVVVPIGDGLDYDVKEAPETVLSMLDGVPVAAVVPVPPPKGLTDRPADVSAEPMVMSVADAVEVMPAPSSAQPMSEGAPTKKKTARKTTTRRTKAKKSEPAISAEQVEKLRKMAPGSEKKLANTLVSQFKIENAEAAIAQLAEQGVLAVDHGHVTWK